MTEAARELGACDKPGNVFMTMTEAARELGTCDDADAEVDDRSSVGAWSLRPASAHSECWRFL